MACRSPKPCYDKGCKCKSSYNGQADPIEEQLRERNRPVRRFKVLTSEPRYYILEVDTLVDFEAYDDPHQPGLKAYSVIKIDETGAHEVDRAYRNVKEALEVWPEAMPPTS